MRRPPSAAPPTASTWSRKWVLAAALPALTSDALNAHPPLNQQAQVLVLASDAPLPPGPSTHLGSLLEVQCADDLCSRVAVGDRVLVAGWGTYHASGAAAAWAPGSHLPLTLGVQVRLWEEQLLRLRCLAERRAAAVFRFCQPSVLTLWGQRCRWRRATCRCYLAGWRPAPTSCRLVPGSSWRSWPAAAWRCCWQHWTPLCPRPPPPPARCSRWPCCSARRWRALAPLAWMRRQVRLWCWPWWRLLPHKRASKQTVQPAPSA